MIETERLELRLPRQEDTPALAEALADPEVMRFIRHGATSSSRDAAPRAIENYLARWRLDGFGAFIIVRRSDNAVIGRAGLLAWDPRTWQSGARAEIGPDAEIELGWMLLRRYWGEGFATEAARALREWGWANLDPPRLISLIDPRNERSVAVARRLGARRSGSVELEWGSADLYVHPRRKIVS